MKRKNVSLYRYILYTFAGFTAFALVQSCTPSAGNPAAGSEAPSIPVLELKAVNAVTSREYPVTIEGKRNIEIRPQVEGYIESIAVDEGDYVRAGQELFVINDRPFREQLTNARAALLSAEAKFEKARLEVERIQPLVNNNVISDIQLRAAQADLASANASVAQARAMVSNAEINLGYTRIKAPVEGYIGRIPMKVGSLVGRGEAQPLTVLSDIHEVYGYFSMSEIDFLEFKETAAGRTLEEKLENIPPVELILADGNPFPLSGRVETVEGQFSRTTGSISFRAIFPNPDGVLRSGNTGRVRLPSKHDNVVAIPQQSTYELQDKVLVFVVNKGDTVVSKPLAIDGRDEHHYFVRGVSPGERIVYSGLSRLRDGVVINPQPVSDTLVTAALR